MAPSKSHVFMMRKGRREGKGGKRERERDRQSRAAIPDPQGMGRQVEEAADCGRLFPAP